MVTMLELEPYLSQLPQWPHQGRHVLAQHDAASIVVYQAFRPGIADEAVTLQRFGAAFSRSRMSWIKPNFLWMMYRSGWATKVDQERVLAIRIRRAFFESLLLEAVPSSFLPKHHPSRADWQTAVSRSEVRLQWDPDHNPGGSPVQRRALQLGLRGRLLEEYSSAAILGILDVTEFARAQRSNAHPPYASLMLPSERVFLPQAKAASERAGIDSSPPSP